VNGNKHHRHIIIIIIIIIWLVIGFSGCAEAAMHGARLQMRSATLAARNRFA